MSIPPNLQRRIEALEAQVQSQAQLISALRSREPQATGIRWQYLAKTIRVGPNYPPAGNTFGLQFIDREFIPVEGLQPVTNHPRSAASQAVGSTLDGRYISEGSTVVALPAPPPPGVSGAGRWHILPVRAELQPSQIVKVYHPNVVDQNLVRPNARTPADNFCHTGFVYTYANGLLVQSDPCLVLFVDDFSLLFGQVPAWQADFFGPALLLDPTAVAETIPEEEDEDAEEIKLPLYAVTRGPLEAFVQVKDTDGNKTIGDLLQSDRDGSFDCDVFTASNNQNAKLALRSQSAKVVFRDMAENLNGDPFNATVVAEIGRTYGPAFLGWLRDPNNTPVFEATISEQEFHGKASNPVAKGEFGLFELYNYADPPLPQNIFIEGRCTYNENDGQVFTRLHYDLGGTTANQVEF